MKKISNIYLIFIICLFISCSNKTASDNNEQTSDSEEIMDGVGGVNWDATEEDPEDGAVENEIDLATATDKEIIDLVLKNVFDIQEIILAKGDSGEVEIIYAELRNQSASIPLNRCYLAKVSDEIAALAFEIYLSENPNDYKDYIEKDISNLNIDEWFDYKSEFSTNKEKLIQVIYFNLGDKIFIGKPEGFPLEQSYWVSAGQGDMMSNIGIKSFNKINDVELGCRLIYVEFLEDPSVNMILFKLGNIQNGDIFKSEVLDLGYISTGEDCSVKIDYNNFRENNNSILADMITTCESGENTTCEDLGKIEGEQTETVELLTLY